MSSRNSAERGVPSARAGLEWTGPADTAAESRAIPVPAQRRPAWPETGTPGGLPEAGRYVRVLLRASGEEPHPGSGTVRTRGPGAAYGGHAGSLVPV